MKFSRTLLLAALSIFGRAICQEEESTPTTDKDTLGDVEIRFNNTVVIDKTYTHRFEDTPVCYTKGEASGGSDSNKYKAYVPGVQYVPGHMGYQPKYVDIHFSQCELGENQMIVFNSPFLSNNVDLSSRLSEDPTRGHLITQELLDSKNGSYSLKIEPGQCLLILSYYAGFAIDETTKELSIDLKGTVNCLIKFVGSDESKVTPSLYMFIGTLIIILLPGVLVVIFGLFIKPREEESKTSVGYQKRLRSSTTCMYVLSFILCFIGFIVLLVATLI